MHSSTKALFLLAIDPFKAVEMAFDCGRQSALSGAPMPTCFVSSADLSAGWRVGFDSSLDAIPQQLSDQDWLKLSAIEQFSLWEQFSLYLAEDQAKPSSSPFYASMMRIWINRKLN